MASDAAPPRKVGYKQPPSEHQFKPGRSGNPKGRPSGQPNVANFVKDALNKPVTVRIDGKSRKVSTAVGMLHALTREAAAGETAARRALLNIADMVGRTNAMTDEAHEKRALRLPDSLTFEEMDFLHSQPRERDRQLCGRTVDWEKIEQQLPSASAIPAFIRDGDKQERQGRLDSAFDTYQDGLARCREELSYNRNDLQVQADFRLGVARIGLLADRLLHEGDFGRALAVADAAITHSTSEYWIMPESQPYERDGTNVFWLCVIRAHACMLLGRTDDARTFYLRLQSNKRAVETSWETLVLRDFVRLRKGGCSTRLMDEIESHYADEGWNTSVVNTKIAPPKLDGEDAVYVDINPDELKSGDLLLKVDKPHEAMAAYLANLAKWSRNLEKQPHREDWKEHLIEAAGRIVRTIDLLFRSGRFITALESADKAVGIAPHLLPLQMAQACALMLLGQRDDQARSVFLQHRGYAIDGRSWDDAVHEKFEDLRNAGCIRPLMDELEHTFATTPAPPNPAVGFDSKQRPHLETTPKSNPAAATDNVADRALINASDILSGDRLLADGQLREALWTYNGRLKHCVAMIASGRADTQILEDNGALPRKFSEVAFAFVLRGEPMNGFFATGFWLVTVPSELPPVIAVRRAHALAFLGRDEEAKELYRTSRGQLVELGLTVEQLIAADCASLEDAGQTLPPAMRDEFQRDGIAN